MFLVLSLLEHYAKKKTAIVFHCGSFDHPRFHDLCNGILQASKFQKFQLIDQRCPALFGETCGPCQCIYYVLEYVFWDLDLHDRSAIFSLV
jgi:hypothetical protein